MDGYSSTTANWKRALSTLKAAVADLEGAGNAIVESVADMARQSAEAVATANRRIDEAAQRNEAAVERVRRDAQAQIDELHRSIEQLREALQTERELRERLSVAQAIAPATATATATTLLAAPAEIAPAESEPCVAAPAAETPVGLDVASYGQQLLDHLESVYIADEAAGIAASELVERLVANLLYASEVFVRRGGAAYTFQAFERLLTAALDAQAGTSFGRRLAVAAFELAQRRKDGRAHVA